MADPLLPMTLGIGASLVKVLLQANGYATEANLVGVAKEGCGILSRWKNRGGDADEQLAKQIAEVLADKTHDMYEECRGKGIDEERLGGVVTEVEILFNKVVGNDKLLLLAVNDPASFSEVLQGDIGQWRKNIEYRLEPYFDKLVEAAVDEYVKLAPWSPKFQIEALKDLTNKVDEILKNTAKESVIFGRRPDAADSYYIERKEQELLHNLINEDPRLRVVLVGMRGCGKSQLASELVRWCGKQKWSLVAWINAVSKEQVRSGLIELAGRLGIETQGRNEESIIEQCFSHLESGEPSDRLIVFDNVEDINHLTKLVPGGDGLRVVVTTTNDCGWKNQSWEPIKIGVFSREDSIKCLLRITDSEDREAADAVAQRLGDLPLSIAQAGTTAYEKDWTLKKYLERLERYSSSGVIKRVPGDAYAADVSNALFMAVDVALGKLEGGEREVARRQLGGLAVLAQSGVPTRWIDPLSTDAYSPDLEENVPDIADENAHSALTTLVKMSVVQQSADKTITMLHQLQAQVLRENWGREKTATREEAFDAAVEILGRTKYEQLPSNDGDTSRHEVSDLIAQLSAIATQDYSRSLFESEQIRLYLYRAFKYVNDLGIEYKTVELSAAVEVIEDVLGPDHPNTLEARNHLAGAYDDIGRFSEAIELYERVLADQERVLGPDHPDTLTTRNNLAVAYHSAGRFGEAIELCERVLFERERVLGSDHPDTLITRNNLAGAYEDIGRFSEAIELHERVLADQERVLGPDHPDTLTTRNNLAVAYRYVGRFGEAIELFERVLADRVRVLGPDHPDTLATRNNLAVVYHSAGRFGEAIELFERVLFERERVFGPDHPDTLTTCNNLAGAYGDVGRFGEAIELFERVLADQERVLGPDHPDTLTTCNNLAGAYYSVGRFDDAIELFGRLLGAEHPLTKLVQKNLEAAKREMNPPDTPSPETGED